MTDPDVGSEPEARLLSERDGRRAVRVRTEPVPRALEGPLQRWLERFLHPDLEERIAARLGLELTPHDRIPRTVDPPTSLARHPELCGDVLLDAIDLALRWDEALTNQAGLPRTLMVDDEGAPLPQYDRLRELAHLARLLDEGGSTYRVWEQPGLASPMLVAWVDPTAQASADAAIRTAEPMASQRLREAWTKAYGRDTDPDGAYFHALRAVEMLACPLVLPRNKTSASLNSVVENLSSPGGAAKWELILTKHGDGSVEPITAMFERLWHGNLKSRHGGFGYREVTVEEARAGVQLAVLLVQWLTDGVLRRREPTSTT